MVLSFAGLNGVEDGFTLTRTVKKINENKINATGIKLAQISPIDSVR
jgi:hypothetical protein